MMYKLACCQIVRQRMITRQQLEDNIAVNKHTFTTHLLIFSGVQVDPR